MEHKPNIIWITLDSVRYDRTSLHSDIETTSQLKRIAQSTNGDSYSHCIAHSYWTRSSVPSMLTGVCPSRHGVGMRQAQPLPTHLDTIQELLNSNGYQTGCITENGLVGPELDLNRGFDRYFNSSLYDLRSNIRSNPFSLLKYTWNIRNRSIGLSTDWKKHSLGYLSTEVAKRWLRDFGTNSRPFFLYIHYNDPHRPYYPPPRYRNKYVQGGVSGTEAAEFALGVHENFYQAIAQGCPFSKNEWAALKSMYDGAIAHTDEYVGMVFDEIQNQFSNETIFIVTADHGELFGEHNLIGHRLVLDDALLRVPLVIHGLNEISHQTDQLIQHADLVRTLLEIVGCDTEQIQGFDLRKCERDFCISQRGSADYKRDIGEIQAHNSDFDTDKFHSGLVNSYRTQTYKYIKSKKGFELFELPDEETDVGPQNEATVSRFDEKLNHWLELHGEAIQEVATHEFSDSTKEQLSDLGYLSD